MLISLVYRDRRKLTFYFKSDKRIDFRDLTKECFRIFKVCPLACVEELC
jgi:cell fate regulator YaaT (PSP1 superfamily)